MGRPEWYTKKNILKYYLYVQNPTVSREGDTSRGDNVGNASGICSLVSDIEPLSAGSNYQSDVKSSFDPGWWCINFLLWR